MRKKESGIINLRGLTDGGQQNQMPTTLRVDPIITKFSKFLDRFKKETSNTSSTSPKVSPMKSGNLISPKINMRSSGGFPISAVSSKKNFGLLLGNKPDLSKARRSLNFTNNEN